MFSRKNRAVFCQLLFKTLETRHILFLKYICLGLEKRISELLGKTKAKGVETLQS